jgi:hypothetical protein
MPLIHNLIYGVINYGVFKLPRDSQGHKPVTQIVTMHVQCNEPSAAI